MQPVQDEIPNINIYFNFFLFFEVLMYDSSNKNNNNYQNLFLYYIKVLNTYDKK